MAVVTLTKILLGTTKKKQLDIRRCCSICGKKLKFTSSITTSQFPLSCWQCMIINMDTWKYAYAWSRLLPSLVVDAIMIVIWYQARYRSRCYWYLITNYRQLTQVAKAYQASYLGCHNDYHKQSYRWLRELYKCSNCKKELKDGWTTMPLLRSHRERHKRGYKWNNWHQRKRGYCNWDIKARVCKLIAECLMVQLR